MERTVHDSASLAPVRLPAVVMETLDVTKFNQQRRTLDEKTPSHEEVWSAIRYLDFEMKDRAGTRNAIIALMAALLIICVTLSFDCADCKVPQDPVMANRGNVGFRWTS